VETKRITPETPEEKLIWYTMIGTYGFYLIGALYHVVPVMAWSLCIYGLWNWLKKRKEVSVESVPNLPASVTVWFFGMAVMLLALWIGHANHGLGVGAIIKSSVGWAKGWALLAVFPFIGCLSIRPEIIYRAACIVCGHTLLLLPVFVGAYVVGLPQNLWISPLKMLGGPGPEFFAFNLYELEPGTGAPRWRFFTPWAPAAGFVANIYFLFALQEKDIRWRTIGMVGSIMIVLMSKSRLGLISLGSVWAVTWFMVNFGRPFVLYCIGLGTFFLGLIIVPLHAFIENIITAFTEARADSSRVRSALGRIAIDRWSREAPIWGHGVVERGPHMVEYMPIGSHHTWFGLLFVKGIVGFFALAIPMLISFFALWRNAFRLDSAGGAARTGLSMMLVLFLYTFGENLEILPYLTWPGLVFIGLGVSMSYREEITDSAKAASSETGSSETNSTETVNSETASSTA